MGRIIIVAGPPGAGKTTVANRLARRAEAPLTACMQTDDIYGYVRKGFVAPWKPESRTQNAVLMTAMAASGAICAAGGYEVYVDGVIGPWFLQPWLDAAEAQALDLRYVVLFPDEAATVGRATRRGHTGAMTDKEVARAMWRNFRDHPPPDGCVIDTTGQAIDETVATVRAGLAEGRFRPA